MFFATLENPFLQGIRGVLMNKKVLVVLVLFTSIALFGGGYLYGKYRTSQAMMDNYMVGDKYRVVRTVGGMLEVATVIKPETFEWKTSWTCPVRCQTLPASISKVSGVAHYSYRIALADHWVLEKKDQKTYVLKVPRLELKTPVAIDLATVRVVSAGSLLAPSGPGQTAMQTQMQPLVNERGQSPDYLAAQKEKATKTVQEFALKWLRERDAVLPEGAVIEVIFSK